MAIRPFHKWRPLRVAKIRLLQFEIKRKWETQAGAIWFHEELAAPAKRRVLDSCRHLSHAPITNMSCACAVGPSGFQPVQLENGRACAERPCEKDGLYAMRFLVH